MIERAEQTHVNEHQDNVSPGHSQGEWDDLHFLLILVVVFVDHVSRQMDINGPSEVFNHEEIEWEGDHQIEEGNDSGPVAAGHHIPVAHRAVQRIHVVVKCSEILPLLTEI